MIRSIRPSWDTNVPTYCTNKWNASNKNVALCEISWTSQLSWYWNIKYCAVCIFLLLKPCSIVYIIMKKINSVQIFLHYLFPFDLFDIWFPGAFRFICVYTFSLFRNVLGLSVTNSEVPFLCFIFYIFMLFKRYLYCLRLTICFPFWLSICIGCLYHWCC